MASDKLATITIGADTSPELDKLVKMLQGQGLTDLQTKLGGAKGAERGVVTAKGDAKLIGQIQAGLAKGTKHVVSENLAPGAGGTAPKGFWDKFVSKFDKGGKLKELNKSLFMLQMSSLGVAFSFQSIINSVMGLFQGLGDLGELISGGVLGSVFSGMAGGSGKNMADVMGVTSEDQTKAWAGFMAITTQFTSLMNALAVKILTPEMVKAILDVIDALAEQLAKPEVAKAIQEIIYAVLDLALQLIPLLPLLASFIILLGESGLLKVLIMIILAAEILLPALAYIQFIFTFIAVAVELVSAAAVLFGISFGWVLILIGAVIVVVMFLINVWNNLNNGMDLGTAIITALGQTLTSVWNVIVGIINAASNFLGQGNIIQPIQSGNSNQAANKTTTVVINNNINKSVGKDGLTAVQLASIKAAQSLGG